MDGDVRSGASLSLQSMTEIGGRDSGICLACSDNATAGTAKQGKHCFRFCVSLRGRNLCSSALTHFFPG